MKKFLDLIFETVPDEKEEEIVQVKREPAVKEEIKYSQPQKEIKTAPSKNDAVSEETINKKDILSKSRARSSFGIDVGTPKRVHSSPKVDYGSDKYESQPPMSPIFGVLETSKDVHSFVAPSITGSRAATQSKIGTVLSPIYGMMDTGEKKEEIKRITPIEDIPADETHQSEKPQTLTAEKAEELYKIQSEKAKDDEYFKEYFNRNLANATNKNEFANRSLEEILGRPSDETYIANNDISLFDDEEEVK